MRRRRVDGVSRRWRNLWQPRTRGTAPRRRRVEITPSSIKKAKKDAEKQTGFHARLPTRAVWPRIDLTKAMRDASQSWTAAESVPTHRWEPPGAQLTDVTQSPCSNCSNSLTSFVAAFHRYTLFAKATASTFDDDQLSRLR